MIVHVYNPSTREAEVGKSHVGDWPGLRARLCLKKTNQINKENTTELSGNNPNVSTCKYILGDCVCTMI
jgi:hypothetical protein